MLRQFRLSVTPITDDEWATIREMGGDAVVLNPRAFYAKITLN